MRILCVGWLAGILFGFEIFSLLALPFIYFHTNTSIKLPKWFFYVFYPAHLALIALVRYFMGF